MKPFKCSNCGAACSVDYLCPNCKGAVCATCIHKGNDGRSHEMEMALRTFRCAKCKELATKRNEKEASMNKDGGAAFPNVLVTVDKNGSQNFIVNNGMTMRQWYKGMAPADEIEGIMGNSIDSVSKFLGILSGNYDCNVHYPMAVARARGVWADAQLAEDAAREGGDDRK